MAKYPFDPAFLDALPEPLAELFRGLELELLEMICARYKASGRFNQVTVEAMRALRSHGISQAEIEEAIRRVTGLSRKKLDELLDDVVKRNQAYSAELADMAGVAMPAALVGAEEIKAIRDQTHETFRNLTGSMGFLVKGQLLPPGEAYQATLDSAVLRMQSGAVSYDQAIKHAVKQLADSGLKTVDYESGHVDQADVAVRRAVLTGAGQINQRYLERSMEELETDLVEVSAHRGARDIDGPKGWENHKAWQGKVYRWRGRAPAQKSGPDQPEEPRYEDITDNWYPDVTPGSHEVQDASEVTVDGVTYKVDGHDVQLTYSPHEKEIAELLEREVGGELHMLPRVNNPQNVSTADYLFRGERYDLKSPTGNGKNTLYDALAGKEAQAENFIFDLTECQLADDEINRQISVIFGSSHRRFVKTIVVIKDMKIVRVVRRKTKS